MKIDKRLSIALTIAIVAFVPAACDATLSIGGGHSIGYSGTGAIYSGSNGDPIVSPGTNTIQAVLNDPGTKDGSTLTLLPGLFKTSDSGPNPYTTIDVSKSVNIVGWWGPTWTHVNGGGLGSVFTIEAGKRVTLSGMTIENGKADEGGGINNMGTLNLNNVVVTDNTANFGGGIYNQAGMVTINKGSSISGNSVTQGGGGIFNDGLGNIATVTINKGSTISGNTAVLGGGIYNMGDLGTAKIEMNGGTIFGNKAVVDSGFGGSGGGIYNDGSQGGTTTVDMATDSSIADNTAYSYGGGFYNLGGTLNMYSSSSITGNFAGISGGGIINNGDNGAGPLYGMVNMYQRSSITDNHADSSINSNDADNFGGGIANWDGIVNMYKGSSIVNNEADFGGGISNNYNDPYDLPGGTVIMNGGSISRNKAWNGAGILNAGTVEMNQGSSITSNKASYVGGGIFNAGDVVMNKGSSITYNMASEGAGVYWVLGSTLKLNKGSSITHNIPDQIAP
jgi:hypothetical protein